MSGSRFSGNFAGGDGGAIHAAKPTGAEGQGPSCHLTITTSTFDGNTAGIGPVIPPDTASGGGLFARRPDATILDSTFSNNVSLGAFGAGGGLALRALSTSDHGAATVANVTVSGNRAKNDGGGIVVDGDVNLYNVTVTNNTAESGNGGGVLHSGGAFTDDPIKVQSSIIATNFDTSNNAVGVHPDVSGTFESQGYNLIGTGDGSTGFSGAAADQVGGGTQLIDPLLGPLADNGGPTQTHAPLPGSPAIDKGNPQAPKRDAACMETDQRGTIRPLDGDGDGTPVCDAGAHETAALSSGSSSTTTTSTTTTTGASSPSTTTSTIAGTTAPCVLSQLPDDSLAGVECAIEAIRSTLGGPPAASCTCKRCSVEPRLEHVAGLVTQAEAGASAKKCRRKLSKARRVAKSLSAKVGSLAERGCIAPGDRATTLDAEADELARRTAALSKSAFCGGK